MKPAASKVLLEGGMVTVLSRGLSSSVIGAGVGAGAFDRANTGAGVVLFEGADFSYGQYLEMLLGVPGKKS